MTESIKKLCLDIVKADTQEDIKNILEKKDCGMKKLVCSRRR